MDEEIFARMSASRCIYCHCYHEFQVSPEWSSSSNSTTTDEIKHLANTLTTAVSTMSSQSRYFEDVAVFLGTTKAGKSTLVNYLLGNNLVGERSKPFLPISIRKAIPSQGGPAIGAGATSETVVPTRWNGVVKLPGLVIWDAPGFDDNRGPVQDIVNAYYIYELFRSVRSLKIVLVVDIDDIINHRVNSFIELLNSVEKLLRTKTAQCFSSIVVVFNKVPDKLFDKQANLDFVLDILKHRILENSDLDVSPVGRDLIRHLIANHRQVGLFGLAQQVGSVGNEIDRGASQAILAARSVDVKVLREVVCPSLADRSQVFLYKARNSLVSVDLFRKLIDLVQHCFIRDLDTYKTAQRNGDLCYYDKNNLISLRRLVERTLEPNIDFVQKIKLLGTQARVIEEKIENDRLLERIELKRFIDRLLNQQESEATDLYLDTILRNAQTEIERIIVAEEARLGEITYWEHELKLNRIRRENEKRIEELKSQIAKAKRHNSRRVEEEEEEGEGMFAKLGNAFSNFFI